VSPDLQQFIRDALARGLPRDDIRKALAEAGWPSEEVEAALAGWADLAFPIPVPRRRPYLSARETFLYLVLFVTLYTTAFNVGALLFEAIERWAPDPVRRGFVAVRYSPDRVRGAVAAVLIAFPIFLALSRLIGRSLARDPEKRSSRIRKWLTYLTLFIAALVIIGDLTYLVSRLLGGELPPRFLLKTLVVFVIAGVTFGHYLGDLRREERDTPGTVRGGATPLARATAVAIFATLALGLVMAGSPGTERQRRVDQQRVEDLRMLSAGVQSYFNEYRALPSALGQLSQLPGGGMSEARDPITGMPYEYQPVDSVRYVLCGNFDTADSTGASSPYIEEPGRPRSFWAHGRGRTCYTLRVSRVGLIGR
jgi:hypothetical protein